MESQDTIRECSECRKIFSNLSNLRRHARQAHPDKLQEIAPSLYKNKSNFKFSCDVCNKNFNIERYLRYHMKSHENERQVEVPSSSQCILNTHSKRCPLALCSFSASKTEDMLKHFEQIHTVTISRQDIEFASFCDFEQWLKSEEKNTQSKFVKKVTNSFKNHVKTMYVCHRSGIYVPEGKGLRSLKIKGSVKINGYCPASIQLIQRNNGVCHVKNIKTHVGHSSDSNLGYLPLTKEERQMLACQIASKVPFDDILDGVRNSISNMELERIHLLRKKDLYNIETCFKLNSNSVRHSNDAISIEAWVNQMNRENGCVMFYKPQGALSVSYPWLRNEDFALMIMTSAQCELLIKYGIDCICLDGTHGLNSYNFELHTLLVLDDLREGFPCAFCISNRSDQEILKLFFWHVKELAGIISPKIFMSDLAESYFNAWKDVMGAPEKRLFCTWHLDRAWRHNLLKIKTREKQVLVYKQLRTLLEERDPDAFFEIINKFCKTCSDDPETTEFAKYFINNYSANYAYWAYSFRLHSGINTNMHLERMHETIKYIYLKGKKVKRLDKAISAIMRFVRDKLIERLIVINKGKLCSKIKDLRSRHKASLSMDSNLIIVSENGWECPSEKSHEIYLIQELKDICNCQLICSECNICIHRYYCSCVDSAIKFNMCKHIHLLASWRKREICSNEREQNIDDERLFIQTDSQGNSNETQVIVHQLSKKRLAIPLEQEKQELKRRFSSHVDSIQSPTKLRIVKNILAPLSPTLNAVDRIKTQSFPVADEEQPHNTNISAQRRLWSTKKKREKSSRASTKPSEQEKTNIALSFVLQ